MDIFDDINDVEIDEDRHIYNFLDSSERKPRVVRQRPDHLTLWDDAEFHKRFRLHKETVNYILTLIEIKIKHKTERNECVPPMLQLLIALRFYATGSFYITIGDFAGLHNSTICKIIKRVSGAIASLRPKFINFPINRNEIIKQQEEFYDIAHFPRVVGAVDCTHIRIISPGGQYAEEFRNRKGFVSLNIQIICTANLMIQDIVARWPGSTHDSQIFSNSAAKYKFDTGFFNNGILLGDNGYFLNDYLITPLSDPQSQGERLFNESHIRTRNSVERCFGVWKRRFPVLSLGIRCKLPLAQDVIVATAVLLNLAKMRNENEPPGDPDLEILDQQELSSNSSMLIQESRSTTRENLSLYFNSLINQ